MLRALCVIAALLPAQNVQAADAPAWMHALVGASVPPHDDKTNAVQLYAEVLLTVQPNGRMIRLERYAYLILRPDGEGWGVVRRDFDDQSRITDMHAWCVPASGKDYVVKDRDAVEAALPGIENGELVTDVRSRLMRIPAATPGNIVGYEITQEQRPYFEDAEWRLQDSVPVRETHYTLQLPPGWDYKAIWINHPEIAPIAVGPGQWTWTAGNLPAVRLEDNMPPWQGIAARMVVALIPPKGAAPALLTWQDIGAWHHGLVGDRDVASAEIRQRVSELAPAGASKLASVRALGAFVQKEIRYVAIELGIGGVQPHPATEVFQHRYGDCKDKATLLRAMLTEVGVNSYYVIINTVRGSVTMDTPPNLGFNHVILAIQLPPGLVAPELIATVDHPKLGKLLFFDPTDDLTPLGSLAGGLQSNTALLVTPDGGELVTLPQLPGSTSALKRAGTLVLDEQGTLSGDVREVSIGDPAAVQRYGLRNAAGDADRIKPVEARLADSLTDFRILKASVLNLAAPELPFEWHYTLEAEHYAKFAGDLMLVRPRVLGSEASGLLETREPRENPIEFEGPRLDSDSFDITFPAGYEVDELPPPLDLDIKFAAYHSSTKVAGRTLHFGRTLEIKQLSVPVSKAGELKEFYRQIWNDERRTAVLRPVAH
jgi:transglutaminase-like putative cysteine protease